MNDKERGKAFTKERAKRHRAKTEIQRDTYGEIVRLLNAAEAEIEATLRGAPSEWQAWYLPQLERSVKQTLSQFETEGQALISAGTNRVWQAGVDLIDAPIAAGGINIAAMLPEIDPKQLVAMRSFMTGRIRDISESIANRINSQLGMVVIGGQTPGDAIAQIATVFEKQGRSRALTIVRTELGRAFSAATQQRMEQASGLLPGLKKQWRRSGKVHSRIAHDGADGQTQKVDDFFIVGGVRLMYPRDPQAPASETVNCGCDALPHMSHWRMSTPGKKPFSAEEIAKDANKRKLAEAARAAPVTLPR